MKNSTLDAINTAALTLLSDKGFSAVGMREIAAQVGISVSVIYHYYKNKDEMYHQLFFVFFEDYLAHILGLITDKKHSSARELIFSILSYTNNLSHESKKRLKVCIYELLGSGEETSLRKSLRDVHRKYEFLFFHGFEALILNKNISFPAVRVLTAYISHKICDIIIKNDFFELTLKDDINILTASFFPDL